MVEIAAGGHQPETGLVAEDAAESGRESDGTADIRANLKGGESRRNGGGSATGRSAGHPFQVPGVAGLAEDLIVSLNICRPARQIGFANDIGAGLPDCGDHGGILFGDVIRQFDGTTGRAHAADF